MKLSSVNELLSRAVEALSEGDVVPYSTFATKRQKTMGNVKIGPKSFTVGDQVKIGKSKPREVLDVNRISDMVMLGSIKKSTGRKMSPFSGVKYLFWGGKSYYLRAAGYESRDTPVKPSEITVIKKKTG